MYSGLSEKQIRDRIRFLSDKMESIWEKISPQLQEFDQLKLEFEELCIEIENRESKNGIQNVSRDTS